MVQDLLADAQIFRSDLQQLVLCQEFQAAFQAELANGDQAQSIIGAGCTGVGQVLGLADVDIHILAGSGVADDHALVDFFASAHQQGAALLRVVQAAAHTMCIREAGQEYPYTLITDSLHNIYNTVTVIAALRQLGYDHGTIARRMAEVKIPASRLSEEEIGGVKVIMQMSKDKNALACSRNFDYIRSKPGKKELLLMMNCLGVAKNWSENPSWMYDTDFEFLNSDDVTCLVCAGPRAYDYQLRLLLAGIPRQKIRLAEDEFAALELLPLTPGDDVYLLYGVDGTPLAFRVREKLKEKLLAKEGAQ